MSSDLSGITFKQDDTLKFAFSAETTAKFLIFATNGRFYTLEGVEAAGRPRPRRAGAAVHRSRAGGRHRHDVRRSRADGSFLVASHQGSGFVVSEDECLAKTRKGKQVLNVKAPDEARAVAVVDGDRSRASARTARW